MPFARSQAAAAQSDVELVAAPGAGKQIVVRHVFVSNGPVATTHTLESGTTNRRWEAYLPASGAAVSDDAGGNELFRCADNESLTVTNTGATTHFTQVAYEVLPSTGA